MAKALSAANAKQLGWAALGVVAGIALFNIAKQVAGNTVVGKVLDGSIANRG